MRTAHRSRSPARPPARRQRGVMLIEVLVGLVIFLVGALGLMGFVTRTMADSAEARERVNAALMAQEYFARLETTISAADRGAKASTYTAALNAQATTVHTAWKTAVLNASSSGLPNGNSTVTVDTTDPNVPVVRLTITWQIKSNSSTRTFVTQKPIT